MDTCFDKNRNEFLHYNICSFLKFAVPFTKSLHLYSRQATDAEVSSQCRPCNVSAVSIENSLVCFVTLGFKD